MKITPKRLLLIFELYKPTDYIKHLSNISKSTNITYSHTTKAIKEFLKYKLVDIKKQGRIKIVHLTPKGVLVASYFNKAITILNEK